MLNQYLTQTTQLLQNPAATTSLYSTADLTSYINRARLQLAGETESTRALCALTLAAGTQAYPFASVTLPTGAAGVFNVRGVTINLGDGGQWCAPYPFPYFQLYYLGTPVPCSGIPKQYSQFAQGELGSLYFAPVPNAAYTAECDCVVVPSALVDDTTVELLPYPYTEAVPFYAAYLAFLSAQRQADAERMWKEYQKFAGRGRALSNGSVLPQQYPQSQDRVMANRLGVTGGGAQQ